MEFVPSSHRSSKAAERAGGELRFLFIDSEAIPDWLLTISEGLHRLLALAAYLFFGTLATAYYAATPMVQSTVGEAQTKWGR
jgi:hypothetical protein